MPLYRPKGSKKLERQDKKKKAKRNWFKKGGHESFIMIPATRDSKLKKMIEEKLKKMNLQKMVKIVEKPSQKFFEKLKILNKKPKISK